MRMAERKAGAAGQPDGLVWLVPIGVLVASTVFSVIAAMDGRWGLLAVMVVIGVFFGLGLLLVHWWVIYRFGAAGGEQGQQTERPGE
jgi:hypothetical protein